MIYVTRPLIPPLDEFVPYLEEIWKSGHFTNNGQFHQRLEEELCLYLNVDHVSLFCNGTIALIAALKEIGVTGGEVITTPYSFVATAHSILWNQCVPVFVDIEPDTCNIDPTKLSEAITPRTRALLPVHCYGNPCDVSTIADIAKQNNLKVLYDAAHAFGVNHQGSSLVAYGDLSVLSFHATKVFTTFEGGAIVSPDAETKERIDLLRNFGFKDEVTVEATGLNGKMSEIGAAFGLLQLSYIDSAMEARNAIEDTYRARLEGTRGIRLMQRSTDRRNSSYMPIFVEASYPISRDELYERLRSEGIFARRYFFPLISDMPMYSGLESAQMANLPNATRAAREVLCLPIYPDLQLDEVLRISDMVREVV